MRLEVPLFQTLIDNKIVFAVCISINTMKAIKDLHTTDRFIICRIQDYQRIKALGLSFRVVTDKDSFGHSTGKYVGDTHRHVCEHDLTDEEFETFKEMIGLFERVIHGTQGRIYELKNNSLLKKINPNRYDSITKVGLGGRRYFIPQKEVSDRYPKAKNKFI